MVYDCSKKDTADNTKKLIETPLHLPGALLVAASGPGQESSKPRRKKLKAEESIKPPAGRVIKIKVNQWMGTCRWTYNQVVAGLRQAGKLDLSKKTLRAQYVNNANFANADKEWVLSTPYDLRDEAMIGITKAYESNFAKRKKSAAQVLYTFQAKKSKSDTIVIHAKHWNNGKVYPTFLEKNH